MSDVVIQCESLGKSYLIGHQAQPERYTALRDVFARRLRALGRGARRALRGQTAVAGQQIEEFWALRDVSFEVNRGEVVGIIGRNGAGKSTLLKILSRITEPSAGRLTLRGRVASLLEVGTGFHPELTGRENIFLNGAILGMTRAEIKCKFDEIVAFAEVEKFLDTPVKRYSSGMYVRLAFAVAAHLEPEILVVDEVLAVGDAEFQKKCLGKMQEVSRGGRTVLFVSHNMGAVRALCTRTLLLSDGRLTGDGETASQINSYLASKAEPTHDRHSTICISKNLTLESIDVDTLNANSIEEASIRLKFNVRGPERIRELAILIYSESGVRVAIIDLRGYGIEDSQLKIGLFTVTARLAPLPLVEGAYDVGIYVVTDDFQGNLFNISQFHVLSSDSATGVSPYPAAVCGFLSLQAALTDVSLALEVNKREKVLIEP